MASKLNSELFASQTQSIYGLENRSHVLLEMIFKGEIETKLYSLQWSNLDSENSVTQQLSPIPFPLL